MKNEARKMRKLSPQSIQKFKDIYFWKYKKNLTDEEAFNIALNLLNLYKLLFSKRPRKEK